MLCASVWLMLSSMLYSLRLSSGSSFPKPLTLEEERYYLEKSAAGDLDARNVLIERNRRRGISSSGTICASWRTS